MKKLCNYLAAACLLVCGCIFAFETQARVCFATDENCGSGGNFPKLDDTALLDDSCTSEGYTETSCEPTKIEYKCPYKAGWKKCCNLDYNYSTCVYPMLSAGQCGGKSKCTCDQTKYKWTEERCAANSKNSMTGGASCAQQVLNEAGNGLDFETYYTECRCDRGAYPKTKDMCDAKATFGDSCIAVDSNGVESEYFADCYCDRQVYTKSAAACYPFVGAEESGHCTSGGVTYYKSCKTCSGWPAKNLDHVAKDAYSEPLPEDYEVCPYAQTTGYYKIKRCREPGYEVNSDGSACEPISCTKAAQMYVAHNDRYLLLTADGTYTYEETIDGETGVASYNKKQKTDFTAMVIVADNVRRVSFPINAIYYSAQYIASTDPYSSYGKILNQSCHEAPTVTVQGENFGSSTKYSCGINYVMQKNLTVTQSFYIVNGSLDLRYNNLYISSGRLDLKKDTTKPNVDNLYIGNLEGYHSDIYISKTGSLWLHGYDMQLRELNIHSRNYTDDGRSDKFDSIGFWLEGTPEKYATVSLQALQIKGLGGIKYANTYVKTSCIGCQLEADGKNLKAKPDTVNPFTMLYLFDANWYMSKDRTTHTVYIGPGCFLGNGYTRATDKNTGNTGTANIVYANNTQYSYINSPTQYDSCYGCKKASFNRGFVVKDDGSLQWVNKGENVPSIIDRESCSIWCDSAGDGGRYGNQAICAVNGNGNYWFAGRKGNKDCWLELGFGSFRL